MQGIILRIFTQDTPDAKLHYDFDGNIIAGSFPNKQATIVKVWALIHKDELEASRELAVNNMELYKMEPLR